MPNLPTIFDTPHDEAFRALGALKPRLQWSAFDVPRREARDGKATRFVTTIWNFHSALNERGRRIPTELAIVQDQTDGTFWYRFSKPPVGATRKTWVAHWNGLKLALTSGIPIVGVLKDAHSGHCSLKHIFDCGNPRSQVDGSAMWLQLTPRGEVGCDVRRIDIRQLTMQSPEVGPLAQLTQQFDAAVHEAQQRSKADRRDRLASAPLLPRRIEVTTTVFDRNPDVVAEVLSRASGVCKGCTKPAPFIRRSDGSPYLEVHHRIPLAVGGEDTVENARALCPNCHRAAHYA
jgi:5-methylcytosine-specific restriction endonuclease McrA